MKDYVKMNYTVEDIKHLRYKCELLYLYGATSDKHGWGRQYKEEDKVVAVEEMVRTYIMAGIKADDL